MLIVGLGNPGLEYAGNRHNVGFMTVDAIARHFGVPGFSRMFNGLMAEITSDLCIKHVLFKPTTYMNLSGRAVAELSEHSGYAVNEITVIHDDLALPLGVIRVKTGGSNAGHKGLNSITDCIGQDYNRIRIGIGHPGSKEDVVDYVLGDFNDDERKIIDATVDDVTNIIASRLQPRHFD